MKTNILEKNLVKVGKLSGKNYMKNCAVYPGYDLFITVKEVVDENFQDYKKASMLIASVKCDFKCFNKPGSGPNLCHNMDIIKRPNKSIYIPDLFLRYRSNPITSAVIIGGLEPILQFVEILNLVKYFRQNGCPDDFVLYTGYDKSEILDKVNCLKQFKNIILKYGRFIPNKPRKFDDVLGVYLNSPNQYAEKVS